MARARAIDDEILIDLMQKAATPLSAYDLLERLPGSPKPKPPVIYRALERLSEQGLIHRIESLKAFVACDGHKHAHETLFAVCHDCQSVQEIEDHGLCGLMGEWEKKTGFMPQQKTFEIVGLCADCRPS
ncbi:MAG: Fur family transcriptional regulator [Parvibaculum sp.]